MTKNTKTTDTIAGETQQRAAAPIKDFISEKQRAQLTAETSDDTMYDTALTALRQTSKTQRSLLALASLLPLGIAFLAAKHFAEKR